MTDPITPATIARLRELIERHRMWAAHWFDTGCSEEGRPHLLRVRSELSEYAINALPSLLDQLDAQAEIEDKLNREIDEIQDQWRTEQIATKAKLAAQAAEIERAKFEREALLNAAICGQRSLHSDMIKRWHELRDVVLHGLDGLDNDQTNEVLSCIDGHFPSDINPAVAEEYSDTENRADKAEARVAELERELSLAAQRNAALLSDKDAVGAVLRTDSSLAELRGRAERLEGLLRKHSALACSTCMGTGAYLGDEDRDGPCDACGGTGAVLPEEVADVLAEREGGR